MTYMCVNSEQRLSHLQSHCLYFSSFAHLTLCRCSGPSQKKSPPNPPPPALPVSSCCCSASCQYYARGKIEKGTRSSRSTRPVKKADESRKRTGGGQQRVYGGQGGGRGSAQYHINQKERQTQSALLTNPSQGGGRGAGLIYTLLHR